MSYKSANDKQTVTVLWSTDDRFFGTLTYLDCVFISVLSAMVYIIRLFSDTTEMITRMLSRTVNTKASKAVRMFTCKMNFSW